MKPHFLTKTFIFLLPVTLLFYLGCSKKEEHKIISTIDLDGIADFVPYAGSQPDLVEGVTGKRISKEPLLRHVYLVAPHILALTIDEFGFIRHGAIPYTLQQGDSVVFHGAQIIKRVWDEAGITPFLSEGDLERETIGHQRFVYRDGKSLGHLVGREGKLLWPVEPILGEPWNTEKAEDPVFYKAYPEGSGNETDPIIPEQVFIKSKPHGKSNVGPGYGMHMCRQHQVYLLFDKPLPPGQKIRLDLADLGLEQKSTVVLLDDKRLRTEAIQVNQAGYHPGQTVKYAFLSTWMGPGGAVDYGYVNGFLVIEEGSGKVVFKGNPERISIPQEPDYSTKENGPVHLSGTHVYILDLSSLEKEGLYRIHIPELGVSFPFPVSRDIWDQSARLQLQGFYHQRSGMALGQPASQWERPRNFHPQDRRIHDVDRSIYFNKDLYTENQWRAGNPFMRLQRSMLLDTNIADAYGGWADAADYDRRVPHLRAVMAMLFLYELDPGYFESWQLPLPTEEASNQVPDILDEALWCTELFRRTQLENGEVIEGVESIEHPKRGEASWLDSQPTAIKAGTPSVAYKWAGVAARMSMALRPYDKLLADQYKESALKAISWADDQLDHVYYQDFQPSADDRISAAVYLYLLTGEEAWHALFKKGWEELTEDSDGSLNRHNPYPVLSYALMDPELADSGLQQDIHSRIKAFAENLLAGTEENSAFLLRPKDQRVNFSIVEQLGSEYLMGAHLLTGDVRFLEGLIKCSHFSMGANPLNLCYITGMGQRFIEPFYLDYEYTGLPIPTGIPAYGPVRLDNPLPPDNVWGWHERRASSYASVLKPSDIRDWPLLELYFRYVGYPAMNEYTIQQGMREQLTRWGYLALHFNSD